MEDQFGEAFQKRARFVHLKNKFGTIADASGYRAELNFMIGSPEEDELTEEDVSRCKVILAEVNEYLGLGEER